MRVLLTGGAGFIGGHVATALLDDGHEVVVLDALLPDVHPGGWPGSLDARLTERLHADVRDRDAVDRALEGVDAVCHQAAVVGLGVDLQDLPHYVGVNELGIAVVLAAAASAGVQRVVLASSMVVYGEGRYACPAHGVVRPGPRAVADLDAGRFEPPCPRCGADLAWQLVPEEAPLDPRSVYAATKTAQEHLCSSWARGTGGTVVALRYHNVYGPRMPKDTPYAGVASLWRSALARGEAPRVFEDGQQQRDFVHVRDVARANLLALSADLPEGLHPFNVASGRPAGIGEVAAVLAREAGGPEPVVTGQYRLGDVRHVVASPERARSELGFAAGVGLEEGLAEFAAAPLRGDRDELDGSGTHGA